MDKNRAFTLVELLVVIAIIAILMSILVPALQAAKDRAKDVMCSSNLHYVGLGMMMYLEDNDGVTADVWDDQSPKKGLPGIPNDWSNRHRWEDPATGRLISIWDYEAYWGVSYVDYMKSREIFGCPAYKNVTFELIYPHLPPELMNEAAYGLNAYGSCRVVAEIRSHEKFVFCHDHVEPRIEQGVRDMFHNSGPGTMNLTHYRVQDRRDHYRGIWRHAIKKRHEFETGGKANILWLDGHTAWQWETNGDDFPEKWYRGN
jgi:prepilin-type N-terminal cleavage/methylation domain-containing protein/prepilin-type processing-associated H-X9-DG protein